MIGQILSARVFNEDGEPYGIRWVKNTYRIVFVTPILKPKSTKYSLTGYSLL